MDAVDNGESRSIQEPYSPALCSISNKFTDLEKVDEWRSIKHIKSSNLVPKKMVGNFTHKSADRYLNAKISIQ